MNDLFIIVWAGSLQVKEKSGKNASRHQNVTQNFGNIKGVTHLRGSCPEVSMKNHTNASSLVILFNDTYTLTFDFVLNVRENEI